MRTPIEIQEKALAALVRVGEVEKTTVNIETFDSKGNVTVHEKKFYKVCESARYGLRPQPREVSIVNRCCASCKYKDIIDLQEERDGKQFIKHGVRICTLDRREVHKSMICDHYTMMPALERV